MDDNNSLATWRCPKCNRILARLLLTPGSKIEIKCSSCNTFSCRDSVARLATVQ